MKRVWAPVFGLLACCLGAGYLAQETQPPVSGPEKTPAKAAPHIVRGIGFVEPTTEIRRLFFRADGVIDACAVEVGQTARRGDVLMSLRNFQEQAEVAVAQQEAVLASAERDQVIAGVNPYRIIAAERNVDLLLAQLRNAKRHYQRIHKIYERGATTVSDDDGAETDVAGRPSARASHALSLVGQAAWAQHRAELRHAGHPADRGRFDEMPAMVSSAQAAGDQRPADRSSGGRRGERSPEVFRHQHAHRGTDPLCRHDGGRHVRAFDVMRLDNEMV